MLDVVLGLAQRHDRLSARLSNEAYQRGIKRLEQAIAQHGVEHIVGSEVTLVEVWAQRE